MDARSVPVRGAVSHAARASSIVIRPSQGPWMDDLPAGRFFLCARCRAQVVLCSRCDRGNIYCGALCAQSCRRQFQRAAGDRYQRSAHGRLAHALRSRRYRHRRALCVTHQGSGGVGPHDQIGPTATVSPAPPVVVMDNGPDPVDDGTVSQIPTARSGHDERGVASARCSRCESPRSHEVRQGWLRHRMSRPIGGRRAATPWSGLIHDSS